MPKDSNEDAEIDKILAELDDTTSEESKSKEKKEKKSFDDTEQGVETYDEYIGLTKEEKEKYAFDA